MLRRIFVVLLISITQKKKDTALFCLGYLATSSAIIWIVTFSQLGLLAILVWLKTMRRRRIKISLKEYLKVGDVLSILKVAVASLVLWAELSAGLAFLIKSNNYIIALSLRCRINVNRESEHE